MVAKISTNNRVLIVGRSGNLLARAAYEAGYEAIVVDAYGDLDTRAKATDYECLSYIGNRINERLLYASLQRLARYYEVDTLCWTSGWETSGHILCALENHFSIAGSDPRVLLRIADPQWHRPYQEDIFPSSYFSAPSGLCLTKARMRAGGHSVNWYAGQKFLGSADFFQPYQAGKSLSLVGVASGDQVVILGWNEHLKLQRNVDAPFRYSAAVKIKPPLDQAHFQRGLTRIASTLGIKGVFGCDVILRQDGSMKLVDLNPRPPATAPLHLPLSDIINYQIYPSKPLAALTGRETGEGGGHAVVYADHPINVPKKINWPAWVSDIPDRVGLFDNGEPICSIWVQTRELNNAEQLLRRRFGELLSLITEVTY